MAWRSYSELALPRVTTHLRNHRTPRALKVSTYQRSGVDLCTSPGISVDVDASVLDSAE